MQNKMLQVTLSERNTVCLQLLASAKLRIGASRWIGICVLRSAQTPSNRCMKIVRVYKIQSSKNNNRTNELLSTHRVCVCVCELDFGVATRPQQTRLLFLEDTSYRALFDAQVLFSYDIYTMYLREKNKIQFWSSLEL